MKRTRLLLGLLGCLALWGCDEDSGGATPSGETTKTEPECGNGTCEFGESSVSCPEDCRVNKCGNGTCESWESYAVCPEDCEPICGNDFCEKSGGETHENCPRDCGSEEWCGDQICNGSETFETCPRDCSQIQVCGNEVCESELGETRQNCPQDCPSVCGDGQCEEGEQDGVCEADCGSDVEEYQSICGDGVCDDGEDCAKDCETTTLKQITEAEFYALNEPNYRFLFDYEKVVDLGDGTAISGDDEYDAQMSNFFAFPYPSALRTDQNGRPKIKSYPLPQGTILDTFGALLATIKTLLPSILERIESERAGFSPIGGVYFRTTVDIETLNFPSPDDTMSADSCFQLINVEPESSHYKERVPLYVTYHSTANKVWADHTLVLRPVPGYGQHPGDRYVAVVGNCLKSNGRFYNQSNKLRYILEKAAPTPINNKLGFYVDQVRALSDAGELGMKIKDIRAFTGYQVMNPADEMDQMATDLKGKGFVVTDEDGVAIGEYVDTTEYGYSAASYNAYIFKGTFKTINYIEGTYPYSSSGSGVINFDAKGKLKSVGKEEIVNFAISIPRAKMPDDGYPLIVYAHGTGGDATTHCRYLYDEGLWLTSNDVPVAMIGYDACLQGARGNGAITSTGGLIAALLNNPIVIRESWRQTTLDALVLYDILERGQLKLPPLPDSTDTRNVIFDPSYGLYMGHSQGSQEGGMLLGLTGAIKSAFLSAGGGGVLQAFVELHPDLSSIAAIGTLLNGKSVADIVGFIFGLQDGDLSYDTFITTQIVQPLVDPLDPLNFAHRFIREPKDDWEPKNIVQTIGLGDQDTPQSLQLTLGAAIGLPTVGNMYEVNDAMRLRGLSQPEPAPQSENILSSTGKKATGGTFQFKYTGSSNPHFVIYRMASGRSTYLNFFDSILKGTPQVTVDGDQEGEN